MYLDAVVKVPEIPGKITFRNKKDAVYVYYEYERIYHSDKHYNVPKRATIGKLIDSQDSSLMIPNEIFAKYFPESVPENRPKERRSGCLHIGTWAVLKKIISDYELEPMLEEILGACGSGLLLDLAAYSIVTEDNAAQHYPAYAYSHSLFSPDMKMYSDSKISEFLPKCSGDAAITFLNAWNAQRDHRERIWISYDSTNTSSQAGDIALLEPGHAKDGSLKPIINCSVAYDKTNEVPLFYEEYLGSIVDVSQPQYMLEKAQAYGYRHAGFILDRGYFSKDNIRYMDKCGYPFVMMIKGKSSLVNSLIDKVRGLFETKQDCSIRKYRTYGTTLERPLFADDKKSRYFHIYHSSLREYKQRELLEEKLDRIEELLKKHENKKWCIPKGYEHYFEAIMKGDTFQFAHRKTEVIEQELSYCGYYAIVTSEKMNASDALLLYKSRDASEKLFASAKSFLGGSTLRVHNEESAEGKLFIEFIALILRNKMHVELTNHIERAGKKANYMSVPASIAELEKIEVLRQADGVYRLDYALSATQKEILRAFNMNETDIKNVVAEIAHTLTPVAGRR